MKNLKKILAIILSIAMVMCSTLPSVASEIEVIDETTKSKIEEQLREDLGEERANEILNVGANVYGARPEDEEETTDVVDEETTSVGAKLCEPAEEEEETTVADEETTSVGAEETTDVETNAETVGANVHGARPEDAEETTGAEDEETTVEDEETTVEANETTVGANVHGARPEDAEETTDAENEETTVATISEPEEIVISIASKSITDKTLYGKSETWMYYWLTDNGKTIHYSKTRPTSTSEYYRVNDGDDIQQKYEESGIDRSKIEKVVFENEIVADTCAKFFVDFTNLDTIINLEYLNTNRVTDMFYMFIGCEKLTSLDLSSFDTSSVTIMEGMFYGCIELTYVDLSSFDTSNVENMYCMFYYCESIQSLDLRKFNTSQVANMESMFDGCTSLQKIIVSNDFDVTSVSVDKDMFNNCNSLIGGKGTPFNSSYTNKEYARIDDGPTSATPGYFTDASTVPWMYWRTEDNETGKKTIIFSSTEKDGANSITGDVEINYGSLDTNTITKAKFEDVIHAETCNFLFSGFIELIEIENISNLKTNRVRNMASMFESCSKLKDLDISNFNTSNVENMEYMFYGCKFDSLDFKNAKNFVTGKVTTMFNMFYECSNLKELDLRRFNTSSVTNTYGMFEGCTSLNTIYVSSKFDLESVTNSDQMFVNCSNLKGGAGTTYDDSNPEDKTYARIDGGTSAPGYFTDAATLPWMYWRLEDNETGKTIIFSSTDEGKTGTTGIAGNAAIDYGSLEKNTVTKAVFEDEIEAVTCWELFKDFNKLELIEGISNFKTENVTIMASMFENCYGLDEIDISSLNTSNVEYMQNMFDNCSSLSKLDLSSLNTNKVVSMDHMFANCVSLKELNLDGIITSSVTYMMGMFHQCLSLTNLNLLSFDTQNTTRMDAMFYNCQELETIVVSDSFKTDNVEYSDDMFTYCEKLVGCYGTTYDETKTNKEYARINSIDEHGVRNPGYFSSAPWMYWYLDNNDTAIHYSSTEPASGGVAATRRDLMVYSGLSKEQREKITNATFENRIDAATCVVFFQNFKKLSSIKNLFNLDTTKVTDMIAMFKGCENLESIHLENLYVTKVKSMATMFFGCEKLKSLELSGWNTTDLLRMDLMFTGCSSLTLLEIKSLNTSKVTQMDSMFSGCSSLKELDLSNFNTSNVSNLSYMFAGCSSLESIYVSNEFIITEVIYDEGMFSGCTSIKGSSGTTYDESHIGKEYARIDEGAAAPGYFYTNDWMWYKYDDTQKTLYLYGTKPDDYDYVISGSGPIEYTGFTKGDVEKVSFESKVRARTCENMFYEFISLKEIVDIENLNTSLVMNMEGMFNSCESLDKIDLSKLDTSRVTNMSNMFNSCNSLDKIDLSKLDTSRVTNMSYMFVSCRGLDELDLTSFNTSNVTDMTEMFNNCENLKSIHLENLEVSKVKFMRAMFGNCKKLESLNLSRWNAKNLEIIHNMFDGCSSLTLLDISNFDTSRVMDMRQMFRDCSELTKLDLTKFDTKKVNDFDQFLYRCSKLTSIDLHSFDTSNVKNMRSMFYGCENLVTIFVSSKFVTTSLVSVFSRVDVFTGCNALIGGAGTTYDSEHTDNEYARIDGGPTSATPGYFTLYVPPTPPAPTYPQNYSSDRDGGGGGSSIAGPLVDVIIPAVTYLPIVKNILATLNNTTSKWTKDAVTNKHKLNIINQNGTETPVTLGFYNYTNVVTHIVNNIPVQTQTNDTYVFDEKGNMIIGWVRTADGKWYLFEYEKTTNEGKMVIGWKKVQGAWYYFGLDGAMLTNAYTPDGHYVGPDGKWVG